MADTKRLSAGTARRLNWDGIATEQARALTSDRDTDPELDDDYEAKVREVFEVAKAEFEKALTPLRNQVRTTLWILLPLLALALGLGCVVAATKHVLGGSAISVAAFSGLLGMIHRAWKLGKDQAILELMPASYEALFGVCQTQSDFKTVFKAFVAEIAEMRSNLWKK